MLQWGRNFFVTEIKTNVSGNVRVNARLQWGRNFFVTEIFLNLHISGQHIRFNGAVTFSLRKFPITIKWKTARMVLQWGRNFFVTEICAGVTSSILSSLVLQWGRNFFVTEIKTVTKA